MLFGDESKKENWMHYECRNGNYIYAGNPCPRVGHHFQTATAEGLGYRCDVCGDRLLRVPLPAKFVGIKVGLSKGASIKYRSQKAQRTKSRVRKRVSNK